MILKNSQSRSCFFRNILISLSALCITINSCTDKLPKEQKTKVDFTQAEMMLDFLSGLAKGESVALKIESILKAEGTELVIKQMNIMRKVTANQYEQLLKGLIEKRMPDIVPVDSSERAKRGIQGLKYNVWVALSWAIEHIDILKERMAILKELDVYLEAKNLATEFLPEPVELSPSLYIVMGGRAGAAAIDGNRIYIDLLIMTYSRVSKNRPLMNESEIIEFFAHEMHHIGLSKYHKSKFGSLIMDENQRRIFGMLRSIVAEGSATYLINSQRNIAFMRKYLKLSDETKKQDALLNKCEDLISKLYEGKFKSQEDYEKENTLMLGHGYHTVGSIMLSIIDQVGGLESIMHVLADPRILLIEYNKAANVLAKKNDSAKMYIFNSKLSQEMTMLGIQSR